MKILYVSGSYPPDKCSFADSAEIIVNMLRSKGIDVEVLSNINWSIKNWFTIMKIVKQSKADVIHLQYPGLGYKFSMVPHFLAFFNRKKTIANIHEVSQFHFLRKISLILFSWCKKVVFTNAFEQKYYMKIYPWLKSTFTSIVPIGSNIKQVTSFSLDKRDMKNIVYFGQIRPQKGIEEVIELAKIIKKNNSSFNITIVGRTYDRFDAFYKKMLDESKGLSVEWVLNKNEEEVSEILGSNAIAYLPYPDGASERRGTLFAALAHQMMVFTTTGEQTPHEMNDCVTYMKTPQDFFNYFNEQKGSQYLTIGEKERNKWIEAFLRQYTWESIIDEYISIYNEVACR